MSEVLLDWFRELKKENTITVKKAKEAGEKVVGIYCTYGPREIVLAADAIPVNLCGTHEETIPYAEKDLPRNLCPLIKSSYGFAVTDKCPYFHFSDFILGETTCDGKKKMFEIMQKIKPVHVMNLPQDPDLPSSLALMYAEMVRLKEALEEKFNVTITEEKLREAIHIMNQNNRALKSLHDLNKNKPALITGMDLLSVSWQLGFHTDRLERIKMLDALVGDIIQHYEPVCDENTPRILITGTPIGSGCEKVLALVEECGAIGIALENCGGYKTLGIQIDESDKRDPLLLIAEKYLNISCSVMSPNHRRVELLEQMVKDFKVDGIIDLTWQCCHTYNVESYTIREKAKNDWEVPFLQIETDYSESDIETLRVRIQAFLEML